MLSNIAILFSVGTQFARRINEYYYNDIHYVWCSSNYNDKKQAATSNPKTICKRLLDIVLTTDRHAVELNDNKAGILRGAQTKLEQGVINENQFNEICQLVNLARYEDFLPIIYIIDYNKVGSKRCTIVPIKERASDASVEYLITNLSKDEFQIIEIKDLLNNIVDIKDIKVGE